MLLAAAFTNSPVIFAIAFAITGGALGVVYMAGITYALQSDPETRGKRVGIHEGMMGAGLVTGPVLSGVVAQYINLHAPFALGAVAVALALVGQVFLWLKWGNVSSMNVGE